jgi:hypothetical protein
VPPVWIPPLLWGVVLWQSFLGWWWYVGSAAPEPTPRVRNKKKRKGKGHDRDEGTRLGRVKTRLGFGDGDDQKLRRRARTGETALNVSSSQERDRSRNSRSSSPDWSSANADDHNRPLPPKTPPTVWSSIADRVPDVVWSWFHRLRQEHRNAAELQAVENEQKRFEVYGDERSRGVPGSGWGLGSYALRADATNEEYDRNDRSRSNRLPDGPDDNEIELRNMGDSDGHGDHGRPLWDDEEERRRVKARDRQTRPELQRLSTPGPSWSWKGPFQRWRLRDASAY